MIGQPRMPRLEGSYDSVGVQIIEVPGGCRAKVFYPCQPTEGLEEAPYCSDGRTTSDSMAGLVGFRQVGLSFLLAHLAAAPSGCWRDAPPVADKLPLLVYSHGFVRSAASKPLRVQCPLCLPVLMVVSAC